MTRAERNAILAENAATIKAQKAKIERAEAAACRMREALEGVCENWPIQPDCDDGDRCGFCGETIGEDCHCVVERSRAALAASAPCMHEAKVERLRKLCGEAVKRLVHFEDYPEDEAFVAELQAAEKGGKG